MFIFLFVRYCFFGVLGVMILQFGWVGNQVIGGGSWLVIRGYSQVSSSRVGIIVIELRMKNVLQDVVLMMYLEILLMNLFGRLVSDISNVYCVVVKLWLVSDDMKVISMVLVNFWNRLLVLSVVQNVYSLFGLCVISRKVRLDIVMFSVVISSMCWKLNVVIVIFFRNVLLIFIYMLNSLDMVVMLVLLNFELRQNGLVIMLII